MLRIPSLSSGLFSALILVSVSAGAQVTPAPSAPEAPSQSRATSADEVTEEFARWETEMNAWDRRYSMAPSNSTAERDAARQREAAGYRALIALSDVQTLALQSSPAAESFAIRIDRKVAFASTGSYVESVYKRAREYAVWAYLEASRREIESLPWSESLNRTVALGRRYSAASTGSVMERAYSDLMKFAADSTQHQFDVELSRGQTVTRDAEAMGMQFGRNYAAASTGSLLEKLYAGLRDSALRSALYTLSFDVERLSLQSLHVLQGEYSRRYQSSPTGSASERYYGEARDLVRAEIGRR